MIDKNAPTENFDDGFDFPSESEFDESALQSVVAKKPSRTRLYASILSALIIVPVAYQGYAIWKGQGINFGDVTTIDLHKLHLSEGHPPANSTTIVAPLKKTEVARTAEPAPKAPVAISAAPTPTPPPAPRVAKRQAPALPATLPSANAKKAPMEALKDIKELFNEAQIPELATSAKPASSPEPSLPAQAMQAGPHTLPETSDLQMQVQVLLQKLGTLSSKLEQIDHALVNQGSALNDISRVIAMVNGNVNAMDARVMGVSSTVSALSNDVSNVKRALNDDGFEVLPALPDSRERGAKSSPHATDSKVQKSAPITYQAPEYVVHAVIPGRAWLKSTKGQIITVTEGESLGDYGKILMIDAANGIVLTSSGLSFR